jgi:hypothetical protein
MTDRDGDLPELDETGTYGMTSDVEPFQIETISELVGASMQVGGDDALASLAQRLQVAHHTRAAGRGRGGTVVASQPNNRSPGLAAPAESPGGGSSAAVSPFQETLSGMGNAASPEPMAALLKSLSDHVIDRRAGAQPAATAARDDDDTDLADNDSLSGDGP